MVRDAPQVGEVVACDVTHEREYHGLLCILGGKHLSPRRFRRTAELAKKVQLERCVNGGAQEVKVGLKSAFLSALKIAVT